MSDITGVSDSDRRRGTIYPSPFFDIAQTYMPPTVKELFRWCAYFFYKDPVIGAVITKLAEYPVTDIVYNSPHKHVREAWKGLLEDALNIKPFLIEIGLDHFTFGNSFVSINVPFVRWLKCAKCGSAHRLSNPDLKYKFSSWNFIVSCLACKEESTAIVEDVPMKDPKGINFVRWDPKNIDIHYNPITGKSIYRYKIPNKIKKAIQDGVRDILVDIPIIFLEALRKKRDIALSDQNLFHFKRPTLAEQDMGWGKPIIIHSMSRMFYLYVLRRAQEAIAVQRILPLEFIFPQQNGGEDPYVHVNLADWSSTVQDEIRKWRVDPNYISVVAVPLGFERLGGDGRALLLGPEIEVTNREITGGMGVPVEFVFGGLSWSGSSVSLRTLENHFLLYRRLLLQFVNWVKDRLKVYLDWSNIELGFTEFKMADDVQRKQIVIQLNAANKISDHTLLTELGFDYDEEQKSIESETQDRNKIQMLMMKAQAEAQGETMIIQAKYQMRAQEAAMKAQGAMSPEMQQQMAAQNGDPNAQAAQGDPNAAGGPQAGAPGGPAPDLAADSQMAASAAMSGAAGVQANNAGEAGTSSGGGSVVETDAAKVAKQWANKISSAAPGERQQVLADLQRQMPNMYRLVMQILAQMTPGSTTEQVSDNARPLPQKAPPRREKGVM